MRRSHSKEIDGRALDACLLVLPVFDMETEYTSLDASDAGSPGPTFQQWWAHLRRIGVIAGASQRMSGSELAEMVVSTYGEVRAQIATQAEQALLMRVASHPCGSA